jgi:DNA polymerase III alpha subunit
VQHRGPRQAGGGVRPAGAGAHRPRGLNGAVELYKACRKHDVKPILGCEIYLVDDHANRSAGRVERNHLTLLAATDVGYRNLVKLSSEGFLEGLHRGKPSLDMAQLAARGEGIIALTGCLASRFCQRLVDGRDDEARAHVDDLMNAFGADNVYFEVQKNGIADQEKANEGIVRIAREVGRPIVGTGDVHYLRREDYHHHTALLCVQTKSTLAAPKMTFDTNEFFLRSSEEMVEAFAEWPEAIASTLEIAERCDVTIELGRQLIPRYLPEGEDERAYLRARVMEGLRARYGDPVPAAASSARDGARGHRPHGLQRLLPHRVGLRQVGEGQRHRGRPRARQRRRLDRRLHAAHHRRRPAALRPALRALPQPRARVDAGHRHRLLGARPRARHAVRGREVRARVGRADHHLRQDVPARATRDARACSGHDYGVGDRWPSSSPTRSRAARRRSATACSPASR